MRRSKATQEPQPAKDVNAAVRQLQAVELRIKGHTWEQIAHLCGYKGGKATAYNVVNAALKATRREKVEELRVLEVERLDALLLAIWPDAVHEREQPVDGDDEETRKTKRRGANLWAVDRVLGIMERRARLLGLDARPAELAGAVNYVKRIELVGDVMPTPEGEADA